MSTTPTGIPIIDCAQCGKRHPATREHCLGCNRPSAFLDPDGMCIMCHNFPPYSGGAA